MFGFFKNKKFEILSPFSGECVPLEKVPDEAFSQKLLGEGVAVVPKDGKFVAPAECTVEQVFDTKHAYVLKTLEGLEFLIHIGIDTVSLGGEGFDNKVQKGQKLSTGELISFVDLDFIKNKGLSVFTPIVFSDLNGFEIEFKFGQVECGITKIAVYGKK